MATLYSTSALDLSVEKCLIDEYDLKIVSSSAAIQVGDSGDCSRVIFGSDTISMFSSYELNRKINYLKIICQVLPSNKDFSIISFQEIRDLWKPMFRTF